MPKVRILDVKNHRVIDSALELARKDAVILELQEAALFEARVAAQLAAWETLPVPCMNDTYCDKSSLVCSSCRLKYARLQVEEEMENG